MKHWYVRNSTFMQLVGYLRQSEGVFDQPRWRLLEWKKNLQIYLQQMSNWNDETVKSNQNFFKYNNQNNLKSTKKTIFFLV